MLLNTIRWLPKDRFRCSLVTFKMDRDLELFQSLPCPCFVHPLRRTYDLGALQAFLAIRRFLTDEGVRIVHTFHETSDLWAGMIAKTRRSTLLVSSRRDMGFLRSAKHDLVYRLMNPAFDLVLTVSEQVRKTCIHRDHISPDKIVTLYNGLEVQNIANGHGSDAFRGQIGVDSASRLVVTVGNIRPVKGIDVLIEAAAMVVRQQRQTTFVVVGRKSDPDYFRRLQERAKSLGIEQNLRFVGESEKVLSLLPQCDLFFLPSRSEGFSNALIEAMACGLPCVATNVGGNAEAIEEGRSGYLVKSEDASAAADRILRLLANPDAAKVMGAVGRSIVEAKFTSDVMTQQLVGHYERLLAAKSN